MNDMGFERYPISHLTVMVVDANPHMQSIVRTILRGFNIPKSIEAASAEHALEELAASNVDLIITDYRLPMMDGLELARIIRTAKDSKNRYVPIIMLTAHASRELVLQARDTGINEFLTKPVSAKDLHQRMVQTVHFARPFIKAAGYIGPDRRRRDDPRYSGKERRRDKHRPVEQEKPKDWGNLDFIELE